MFSGIWWWWVLQTNGLASGGQGGGAVNFAPKDPTAATLFEDCHFAMNRVVNVLPGQWRHFPGVGSAKGRWVWQLGMGGGAVAIVDGTASFARTTFDRNTCLSPAGTISGGGALTILGSVVWLCISPIPPFSLCLY